MPTVPDADVAPDMVKVGLYLPEELAGRLTEAAKAKRYRSRNALIVAVLKAFVEEYEREQKGGKR